MEKTISLKTSCRSRLNADLGSSFHHKTFSLREFMSVDFIDSLFAKYGNASHQTPTFDYNQLADLVNKTQQMFTVVRQQIEALEADFVKRLTTFFTQGDNGSMEKQSVLQHQMKRCHQEILKSSFVGSALVDEFAELLREYETSFPGPRQSTSKERVNEAFSYVNSIQKQFENALSVVAREEKRIGMLMSSSVRGTVLEASIPKKEAFKVNMIAQLGEDLDEEGINELYTSSTVINLFKRNCILVVTQNRESDQPCARIFDGDQGNILSTSNNLCEGVEICTQKPTFSCMSSLNMLMSFSKTDMSVGLYRVSSRGTLRRVANVPLDSFFSLSHRSNGMAVEVLQPHNYIAVSQGRILQIVNILTRIAVKTYCFKTSVEAVRYIQDYKYLVVVFSNNFDVHKLSDKFILSERLFSSNLIGKYNHNPSSNVILTVYYDRKVHKVGLYGDVENESKYTFTLYKINRTGVTVSQTEVDVVAFNGHFSNWDGNINMWCFIMNRDSTKLNILYSVDESTQIDTEKVDFNKCITSGEDVSQDVLQASYTPVALYKGQSLYLCTYTKK